MLMVYGKLKKGKRFKPFDMKNNRFVVNKIHATVFDESQAERLQREIDYMNNHNEAYIFEIRRT